MTTKDVKESSSQRVIESKDVTAQRPKDSKDAQTRRLDDLSRAAKRVAKAARAPVPAVRLTMTFEMLNVTTEQIEKIERAIAAIRGIL